MTLSFSSEKQTCLTKHKINLWRYNCMYLPKVVMLISLSFYLLQELLWGVVIHAWCREKQHDAHDGCRCVLVFVTSWWNSIKPSQLSDLDAFYKTGSSSVLMIAICAKTLSELLIMKFCPQNTMQDIIQVVFIKYKWFFVKEYVLCKDVFWNTNDFYQGVCS